MVLLVCSQQINQSQLIAGILEYLAYIFMLLGNFSGANEL